MFFLSTASWIVLNSFTFSGGNLEEFLKSKEGILAESEVIKILNSLKAAL